jgi:hypothetical protein
MKDHEWASRSSRYCYEAMSSDPRSRATYMHLVSRAYSKFLNCSDFSRRQYAQNHLADNLKVFIIRSVVESSSFDEFDSIVRKIILSLLEEVNWNEVSGKILIDYERHQNISFNQIL